MAFAVSGNFNFSTQLLIVSWSGHARDLRDHFMTYSMTLLHKWRCVVTKCHELPLVWAIFSIFWLLTTTYVMKWSRGVTTSWHRALYKSECAVMNCFCERNFQFFDSITYVMKWSRGVTTSWLSWHLFSNDENVWYGSSHKMSW